MNKKERKAARRALAQAEKDRLAGVVHRVSFASERATPATCSAAHIQAECRKLGVHVARMWGPDVFLLGPPGVSDEELTCLLRFEPLAETPCGELVHLISHEVPLDRIKPDTPALTLHSATDLDPVIRFVDRVLSRAIARITRGVIIDERQACVTDDWATWCADYADTDMLETARRDPEFEGLLRRFPGLRDGASSHDRER